MNVVVIGCGRLGSDLAYRMFQRGHNVSIIDQSPAAFNNLPSDFEGRTNEGDALNQDVLQRAGMATADAVAIMTNSDSLNAVLGHLARSEYNIKNVIVRNYDPILRPLLEAFELQNIASTVWGAQRAEEMLSHNEVLAVYSSGNGEVEVYEVSIPAEWNGKIIGELLPSEGACPVSLTRAGRAMLVGTDDTMREGDVLDFSATFEGADEVRQRLGLNGKEA